MRCADCRTSISAHLDGEDAAFAEPEVDAHLSGCASCRDYRAGAAGLHRKVRLAPADPVPNLTASTLAAIDVHATRNDRGLGLRVCLGLVAVLQIVIAAPGLVVGEDAGLPVHAARHVGAFSVALAIGFLVVAFRPRHTRGLLPVAAALVVCLVGTSLLDVAAGDVGALSETVHITEIVGLAILWLIARPIPEVRAVRLS